MSGPFEQQVEAEAERRLPQPTKAEKLALVTAYAKMKYSKIWNEPIRTQQRLHDAYEARLEKFQTKYRELLGTLAPEFFEKLDDAAERWKSQQIMFGPGRDW